MADRLTATFNRIVAPGVSVRVDLDIEANDGAVTVLFGPSGSGKTTILRCLAGLEQPQEGRIRFGDDIWFDAATGVNRTPQHRQLAYVSQDYSLFPHLTVEQNIRFGMDRRSSRNDDRVTALLQAVRLEGLGSRSPSTLSGGERQRVALARALARNPRLILLDEPLTALDLPLRDPMRRELREVLRATNVPSIVVTHDRIDALTLGDRMAVLSGGRIRQIGPVDDVFSRPVDAAVAAAVGIETVAPGAVVDEADGIVLVRIGAAELRVAQISNPGNARSVFVSIRGEDVTLERGGAERPGPQSGFERPAVPDGPVRHDLLSSGGSARNRLPGQVVGIQQEGAIVRVLVDCGFALTAIITRPACEELGLVAGAPVVVVMKATAIHLIPRGTA